MPCRLPGQKMWRFVFISFRILQFSDGRALAAAVGAAIRPTCIAWSEAQTGLPTQKSWLREPRMCRCSVTLLAGIGGEWHLQEQLQAAAQKYRSAGDINHQLRGRWATYTAVRAVNSFADWGVVDVCAERCVS